MSPLPPVVAVVGATAAGKTGLSLDLAEALGGEVVNTDAMQLYRGLDVGTAAAAVADPPQKPIKPKMIEAIDAAMNNLDMRRRVS